MNPLRNRVIAAHGGMHRRNKLSTAHATSVGRSEAAEVIAGVTGKPMKQNDIDRDVWIQGSVAAGVHAEYVRCCGC